MSNTGVMRCDRDLTLGTTYGTLTSCKGLRRAILRHPQCKDLKNCAQIARVLRKGWVFYKNGTENHRRWIVTAEDVRKALASKNKDKRRV